MEEQNILEKILQGSMEPTYLPLELLREITDGFSTDRIIGEGGFGTVYKGIVGNRNVAVKRIRSNMTVDDKLFRREAKSLMEVNHQNVIRFLGLCSHTIETPMKTPESGGYILAEIRERLLCFEYIGNGSLDKKITDELRGLEWDKRYEIIKGICTGLHYLHVHKRILHMDLKPANILLDNNLLPKITDFGLSRPQENSQTISTNNFFSLGYCAPENMFGGGRMIVQSDMYSLGVIIIEIVTGNKGIPNTNDNILRRWRHRWNKSKKGTWLEYHGQVTKCIEIGSLCQNIDPYARPSISEIMSKFVELESMDNCRTIAHNSTAGQIKPPYWEDDMLGVEPLELQFANSGNNKHLILCCSVELTNNTNSFIAFNIQNTSPLPYSVEPNKDIVKPQSKCTVEITLPAANTQDHQHDKREFIVRSLKVNECLTVNDVNEEVFDDRHRMGQHVDEIYLSVISAQLCNKEVTESSTNQAKQYASSEEARPTPIQPGSVQLVIKNDSTVVPLFEHKKKVMVELTGGDYTGDRPGLDLVAVVDVSGSLGGWKEGQLKTAMRFLVGKLSPMDRLCVITVTHYIKELWPLRQITEARQRQLHDLISNIEPGWWCTYNSGLQAGLNVLADREVVAGRVAAIMLVVATVNHSGSDIDARRVDSGNVPVYTFYLDNEYSDPRSPLPKIAAKSMGGTFSHVMEQDIGGLTMAFSQCLAGLLSVAVQNLELTVAAVGGESTIVNVSAGSYPQEHQQKENGDSVTVRFGNLYSREVRKVIVELLLLLPTIQRERSRRSSSTEILHVTYSHDSSPGRMKFVATSETLTVCRSGLELPEEKEEEKKPEWLLAEEARLQTVLMAKEERIGNSNEMQDKLVEAQDMPSSNKFYPWKSCHDRQRSVWIGSRMRLFTTPRMDKYLQQANKFVKEPTMPLPSVDDDVKEEMMGALTVDVASREKEMRVLALDVVRLRPPPPPQVNKSGGIFSMFRKKRS